MGSGATTTTEKMGPPEFILPFIENALKDNQKIFDKREKEKFIATGIAKDPKGLKSLENSASRFFRKTQRGSNKVRRQVNAAVDRVGSTPRDSALSKDILRGLSANADPNRVAREPIAGLQAKRGNAQVSEQVQSRLAEILSNSGDSAAQRRVNNEAAEDQRIRGDALKSGLRSDRLKQAFDQSGQIANLAAAELGRKSGLELDDAARKLQTFRAGSDLTRSANADRDRAQLGDILISQGQVDRQQDTLNRKTANQRGSKNRRLDRLTDYVNLLGAVQGAPLDRQTLGQGPSTGQLAGQGLGALLLGASAFSSARGTPTATHSVPRTAPVARR